MKNRISMIVPLFLLACGISAAQSPDLRQELDDAFNKGMALRQKNKFADALPLFIKAAELAPKVFGPEHVNTASIVHQAGVANYALGRFREAEPFFRRGLELREKLLPKDHPSIAQSLSYLGATMQELGQFAEAEETMKSLLELDRRRKPIDFGAIALALNNLGVLYDAMARYEDAERVCKECLALREKFAGTDSIEVADTAHNLAAIYLAMGLDKQAEALANRALRIRETKYGPNHLKVADSLNLLGMIHQKASRFAQGEMYFTRSLKIREETLGKEHFTTATLSNNLGLLYSCIDRHGEAEIYFRRALAVREATVGPDHPTVATTLNNLAVLLGGLGRGDESEKMLLRSLKIRETKLGPNHPETASALINLGGHFQSIGRAKEARELYQRALDILEARFGKDHVDVATPLNNLAVLDGTLKNPAAALPLLQRVLKIREAHDGPDHPNTAIANGNLGNMYRRIGELPKADAFLERCIRLLAGNAGAERGILANRLQFRAEINQAMGKTGLALQLTDQSLDLFQAGLADIFAYGSETQMHTYVEFNGAKLPSLLSIASKSNDDPTAIAKAFDWTLRLKGAVFDTLCRYRQAQHLLPKDDAFHNRVARYRAQKEYLANMALSPPTGKTAARLQKQIEEAREEVAELEKEMNRVLAQKMPDVLRQREIVTAAMVQTRLPAESALVEFLRAPIRDFKNMDWHDPHYFAFVLRPGKYVPRLIDLGPAKEIDGEIESLRKEITDFQEKLRDCESDGEIRALEKKEEKPFKEKSAKLHARLFAPLANAIGDAKLLYLAADGALNRLTFEALVDADGKYLIEHHRCAYLASGRDLLRAPAKLAEGTVVFAGPDYKLEATERIAQAEKLLKKKEAQLALRGTPLQNLRSAGWKHLPGAAAEAADIKKALHGGAFGPVKTYVGREALEEVLKAMPAPRVLHLATHGFFLDREVEKSDPVEEDGAGAGWTRGRLKRMENPLLRSGIVLAGANAIGDKDTTAKVEDGWVTAEEIALLNLQGTELVVLSACQTGLGDIKTGEGVYGLRRAFLHAGARTLLTSLFEVPDSETRDLMNRFYGGLKSGQPKLAAFHTAQIEIVRNRRAMNGAAHPFFWASFVLVGDPD